MNNSWRMENEFVKVKLSPKFGAIISLVDKRTGREMIDAQKRRVPHLQGHPQSGLWTVQGGGGEEVSPPRREPSPRSSTPHNRK
jgi:hypothetical protein